MTEEIQLIGFIKEHDEVSYAESFAELQGNTSYQFSPKQKAELIFYLSNSELIFAWMGYASDIKTGKLITPHGYRSDGKWIWPTYLPYYLEKYDLWSHYNSFLKSIALGNNKKVLAPHEIERLYTFLRSKI